MSAVKRCTTAILAASILLLGGCAEIQEFSRTEDASGRIITLPPETSCEETAGTLPDQKTADDPVFSQMYAGASGFQDQIEITGTVTGEMIDEAFFRLTQEYPELFWVNGHASTIYDDHATVYFGILMDLPAEQRQQMSAGLEQAAEAIAAQAAAYPSDYEKVKFVHDYIAGHTEYDYAGAAAAGNGLWGTCYGCLVEGSAVCQGYAEAFHVIMKKLGIPSGIASGMTERGLHAWNYVQVNGAYYWVDVTWDDPSYETGESVGVCYSYFLINDEMMFRHRTLDSGFVGKVPVCSSLNENYYVRNGNYLTDYRFEDMNQRLSAATDGIVEVMFSSGEAMNEAVDALFVANEIWNADVLQGYTGSLTYSKDDKTYVLKIMF